MRLRVAEYEFTQDWPRPLDLTYKTPSETPYILNTALLHPLRRYVHHLLTLPMNLSLPCYIPCQVTHSVLVLSIRYNTLRGLTICTCPHKFLPLLIMWHSVAPRPPCSWPSAIGEWFYGQKDIPPFSQGFLTYRTWRPMLKSRKIWEQPTYLPHWFVSVVGCLPLCCLASEFSLPLPASNYLYPSSNRISMQFQRAHCIDSSNSAVHRLILCGRRSSRLRAAGTSRQGGICRRFSKWSI